MRIEIWLYLPGRQFIDAARNGIRRACRWTK